MNLLYLLQLFKLTMAQSQCAVTENIPIITLPEPTLVRLGSFYRATIGEPYSDRYYEVGGGNPAVDNFDFFENEIKCAAGGGRTSCPSTAER